MLSTHVQRWENGDLKWRPSGEVFQPSRHEVARIDGDAVAKTFVKTHHYSRSFPAARFRHGLYDRGILVGVAVYSVPMHSAVLTRWFPQCDSVELGRFVLLDECPGNSESWFLARSRELLREDGIGGIVSFSDPVPRTLVSGKLIFPGHVGTIYQASNAVLAGRGTARKLMLLPDGRVFSERSASKIKKRDRGWVYAASVLQNYGADNVWDDAEAWAKHWISKITRPLRHPGNYRYLFALDKRVRRTLPKSDVYPKIDANLLAK